MSRQRRNFSAKFKSDLVIELLKGEKDLSTLETENSIQPNQLRNWKKEFLNNASAVFGDKREENLKDKLVVESKEKAEYAKKVGQLTMQVDWLKKIHYKYYKQLFEDLGLPYVTLHYLRSSFSTILTKNDFNLKSISNMLGHATEIISADVYGDTQEIIEDCLDAIEPFIEEVMPEEVDVHIYDYTDLDVMEEVCGEMFVEVA